MGRHGLLALLLGLCLTSPAHASLVWDRASPATDRGGLLASLSDPNDPQVAWVASETRVWVTDDGGNAWYLVAQILSTGLNSDSDASAVRSDDDDDAVDDEDNEEEEESFDEDASAPIADDEVTTSSGLTSGFSALRKRGDTPPVVRLRLVGGQVFLTGDRGIWAIDRDARTLGSAVEVRLARAMAVRDLLQAPWGPILVATSEGLREIDDAGIDRPGRGALGERDILAMVHSGQSVFVATRTEGLWRVDNGGIQRLGVAGIQGARDLIALKDGDIVTATPTEVLRLDAASARILQRWPIKAIERLAEGRNGRLWAVGSEGAWSWSPPNSQAPDAGQWKLQTEGLGDRRLKDVSAPPSRAKAGAVGDVHLWAVGRGGAWRRVPERVWLSAQRERATDVLTEEGAPPVWELLEGANQSHKISTGHLAAMRRRGQWAFVLPSLKAEYQYRIRREEDLLTIPDLDTDFITQVQVYPSGHHVKVLALWDLYPVVWAFIGTESPYAGPTIAEETLRALQKRRQIRSAVVGLYTLWTQRHVAWRTGTPPSAKAALKSILSLQHIEADLHVLSDRRFAPMTTLETIQSGGTP